MFKNTNIHLHSEPAHRQRSPALLSKPALSHHRRSEVRVNDIDLECDEVLELPNHDDDLVCN